MAADGIKITKDGLEGSGFDHWSTEKTLKECCDKLSKLGVDLGTLNDLEKLLKTMAAGEKVDTQNLKGVLDNLKGSKTQAKDATESLEGAVGKLGQGLGKSTRAAGDAFKAFKDQDLLGHMKKAGGMFMMPVESMAEAFSKVSGVVSAFGAGIAAASKKVIDSMKFLGEKMRGAMKAVVGFIGALGGLAVTGIAFLIGAIEGLGDSFFQLYDTGINFAKGLEKGEGSLGAMAQAAADARLTVGEFAEFLAEHSRVAVAVGAQAMGQLSDSVRRAIYPMGNLGLTAMDVNDYLGEYLETQRVMGVLDSMSRVQQTRQSTAYLETLTQMTQISGKRRKQIEEEMKQGMKKQEFNAWLMSQDKETQRIVTGNMTQISAVMAAALPAEALSAFSESFGLATFSQTEYAQNLIAAGYSREVQMLEQLRADVKNKKITDKQAKERSIQIAQSMKQNKSAISQTATMMQAQGGRAKDAALAAQALQASLQGVQLDGLSTSLDEQAKALGSWDAMQRAVSQSWTEFVAGLFGDETFNNALNSVAEVLRENFAPGGPVQTFLKKFAHDLAPKIITGLTGVMNWLNEGGLEQAFERLKNWLDSIMSAFKPSEKVQKIDDQLTAQRKKLKDASSPEESIAIEKEIQRLQALRKKTASQSGESGGGIGPAISAALAPIGGIIAGTLKDVIWDNKGKIIAAIVAVFAAKAVMSAIGAGITTAVTAGGAKIFGRVAPGAISAVSAVTPGAGSAVAGAGRRGGGNMKVISKAMGQIGKGVGDAFKNLLKGIAGGLKAFTPAVLKGAVIFSGAVLLISGAFAGAAWMLGKTLDDLAEGLSGFNDIDGWNLIKVGGGMTALGVGIAAMGAGSVLGAIGNLAGGIISGLGSLVGVKGPIPMLEEFAAADIDATKVKATASAMVAFSTAMAAAGAGTAAAGIGTLVGGITGALGKLFGAKDPMVQLKKFSEITIDAAKVKLNAQAMTAFGDAMSAVPEIKGDRVGGLLGGIASFFAGKVTMPWDQVKKFGALTLDPTGNIEKNAAAMTAFGNALSSMPEKIEGTRGGGLFGAIAGLFKGATKMPWDQVKEFGEADLGNTANVKKNAEAMTAFGNAMASMPEKIDGKKVGGIFGAIALIWTGVTKMPWDQVKDFSEADLGDVTKIEANAKAMSAFGTAMSTLPEEGIDGKRVGGIFGAIGFIFSGKVKYPWDKVKDFSKADLGKTVDIESNAKAVSAFSAAVSGMPTMDGKRAGGVFGAIAAIFKGGIKYPWDQVKDFGATKINAAGVVENAGAVSAFGKAMASMPEAVEGKRAGGIFGAIASIFKGGIKYPWDQIKAFGEVTLNAVGVEANAGAVSAFGKAMASMPKEQIEGKRAGGVFGAIAAIFKGGIKYPWDQVKAFGEIILNADQVKANAYAVGAFAVAMNVMPKEQVDGKRAGGIFGAIASIFKGDVKMPWDQVKAFGEVTLNAAAVEANVLALSAFGMAMKLMPEAVEGKRAGGIFSAVADAFAGGIVMPWEQVKEFGKVVLDEAAIEKNVFALSKFGYAMQLMPDAIEGTRAGGMFSAVANVFAGDIKMPWDQVKEFQKVVLDEKAIEKNVLALSKFFLAMKLMPEAIEGKRAGGIFGAVADVFAGDIVMPWDQVKEFQKVELNEVAIEKNVFALSKFGMAMKLMPEAVEGKRAGGVFGAIASVFAGKVTMPWDQVKAFGEIVLNTVGITANAEAISAFGTAMANMPEAVEGKRVGGIFGAIVSAFAGGIVMPWDQVKAFGEVVLNAVSIGANAEAIAAFGTAISGMPAQVEGTRAGGVFGAIASMFAGDVKMPWDQVKAFADADMGDTTKLETNVKAMTAFSTAMSNVPTIDTEKSGGFFGAIAGMFKGQDTMPWDQVKKFGDVEINAANVVANAGAMQAFGSTFGTIDSEKLKQGFEHLADIKDGSLTGLTSAITSLSTLDVASIESANVGINKLAISAAAMSNAIPKDIKTRLSNFGHGLEEMLDYIDDGEIKTLGLFADNMVKLGPVFNQNLAGPKTATTPATPEGEWVDMQKPGGATESLVELVAQMKTLVADQKAQTEILTSKLGRVSTAIKNSSEWVG